MDSHPNDEAAVVGTARARQMLSGCGKGRLYDLIRAGQLDARRLGGRTVITLTSLRQLVDGLPRVELTKKS